jgi:ectoine hydroxylase-related dioxygenase (phytanoyl-CoA dioxygenase family)
MIRIDCHRLSGGDLSEAEPVQLAYDCLVKNGYAILDHVLAEDKARELRADFNSHSARHLQNREFADTLEVGDRRHMVPIELAGAFRDPVVYANPVVVAVVREALGWDAILESFGAIVSLAGSRPQHIHRDGPLLFDSAISPLLPAHALTFALPLVDMNEAHGTTAFLPGSHRWKDYDKQGSVEAPAIPVGSCALWDFRVYHGGTANRSDVDRPIVYGTYARPWFQDVDNFVKPAQQRLAFDASFLESVPEDRRSLFSHVRRRD